MSRGVIIKAYDLNFFLIFSLKLFYIFFTLSVDPDEMLHFA